MSPDFWGFALALVVSIGGLWAYIDRRFQTKEAAKAKDDADEKLRNERDERLWTAIDDIKKQGETTHTMVMTQLPLAIQQACILGVTEGAKIVRAEVRAARSNRLPIRRQRDDDRA